MTLSHKLVIRREGNKKKGKKKKKGHGIVFYDKKRRCKITNLPRVGKIATRIWRGKGRGKKDKKDVKSQIRCEERLRERNIEKERKGEERPWNCLLWQRKKCKVTNLLWKGKATIRAWERKGILYYDKERRYKSTNLTKEAKEGQ